jgi:hypothetical protein
MLNFYVILSSTVTTQEAIKVFFPLTESFWDVKMTDALKKSLAPFLTKLVGEWNGLIPGDEFKKIVNVINANKYSPTQLDSIVNAFDTNKDGKISLRGELFYNVYNVCIFSHTNNVLLFKPRTTCDGAQSEESRESDGTDKTWNYR